MLELLRKELSAEREAAEKRAWLGKIAATREELVAETEATREQTRAIEARMEVTQADTEAIKARTTASKPKIGEETMAC
jgi:hypothetical protein